MKYYSILLVSFLITFSASAQQTNNTVTVTVDGNKNMQLSVGGRDYTLTNGSSTGNKTTITVNNLEMGQQNFLLTRTDLNSSQTDRVETSFNLRYGYNLLIKVNSNSSLELIETKRTDIAGNQTPMTNATFATLLRTVKVQQSASGKRNVITSAFNKTTNYFTTYQARQLLQQVNGENQRIQLAKLSYRGITDRSNFNQLYSLINSQAGKDDLMDYVNNYGATTTNTAGVAMTNTAFNNLYQEIRKLWPVSTQVNGISSAFSNNENYFTAYQSSQLIQLVSAESSRLMLAKLAWHKITDLANFGNISNLISSQTGKDELAAYMNTHSTGTNPNLSMTDASFNTLYQSIQSQWSVDNQISSLTTAFNTATNYYSTYQAGQLIRLISTESSRLQLAKLSYRGITDRNNFTQINDLFNIQASKDDLTAFINSYNTGTTYNPNPAFPPMTEANFSNLYQNIQGQFFPNEKMNSLIAVFNNTSNYFSSSQTKQLLQLVSLESNKLQLAKLSYRGTTDRENFNQLYTLFNNQDNRTELEAYVKAYK
jgi:hypothetical protein